MVDVFGYLVPPVQVKKMENEMEIKQYLKELAQGRFPLVDFIIKSGFVTICIGWLLFNFYPCYQFIDATHRCNTVTGEVEYYNNNGYRNGWYQ
jgi:hypothetical protein